MNNAGVAALDGKTGTSWKNRATWKKVFDSNVEGYVFLPPKSCTISMKTHFMIQGSKRSTRLRTGEMRK